MVVEALRDKVTVITGAASGIGAATARTFSAEGATVVICDVDPRGAEVAADLPRATFFRCDTSKFDEVERMQSEVLKNFGRVDVVFANAGVAAKGLVADMTEEFWDDQLSVNLKSVWLTTKAFLPSMCRARTGAIIATSSQLGLVGSPGFAAYGAAKAGIILFIRCLAAEVGEFGIRANALCPGPVDTPGTHRLFTTAAAGTPGADETVNETLVKRFGRPEEIASAALFLATGPAFMTGSVLVVDGGFTTH